MTVTERDVDLKLYYCRVCTLHDRVTTRFANERPTMPCAHSGSGPKDCKRIEWVERNWYCVRCSAVGKTSIYYGTDIAHAACQNGHRPGLEHGAIWAETEESRYVYRDIPFHGGRS